MPKLRTLKIDNSNVIKLLAASLFPQLRPQSSQELFSLTGPVMNQLNHYYSGTDYDKMQ